MDIIPTKWLLIGFVVGVIALVAICYLIPSPPNGTQMKINLSTGALLI